MAFAQLSVDNKSIQYKQKLEFIDAHCHEDMLDDEELERASRLGVTAIIVNGVDTKSNIAIASMPRGKMVFAALGIHPDNAVKASDDEINYNMELIRSNSKDIVAIGEIGLDFKSATTDSERERQKQVFKKFVSLAMELDKPVSVHSREAIDETLDILGSIGIKKVHIHFFEGNESQAQRAAGMGFMMSVPPMHSAKRLKAIANVPISNIMAETDSPTAGMHIYDIDKSVMLIAKAKGIEFDECAVALANNTKRFFNIGVHNLIR
ncbi:TatD family hydrolase [Candidatus Marsarchaeota archaeon]|nr:TatD family hydrolase [Candidatus Marsarchaeota archaeon]MCL5404770.1 TatD family hydrolase [Candidatus Marsarchaeota archaeon]